MKRKLAVTLAMVFVLSTLISGSALAEPKGAVQLGAGMATVNGAPMMGLSWDVFTLHAAGMYFPSPWATLIADLSYGLPHEYKRMDDEDTQKITAKSAYLDLMAGACKHFNDGGFFYASAGLSVGWAGLEISDSDSELEIDTALGIVVGAGLQVPISNTFMGFANLRQRFISSELKEDDFSMDMNIGGFEMTAGIAWTFGE